MPKPTFAVAEFKLPKEMRYCTIVDFTAEGQKVIGFNGDGEVALWDAMTGEVLQFKKLPTAYGSPSVWMSSDRLQVAVSFVTKPTISVDTGTLETKPLLEFVPVALAWSRNGELMAVADREKNVRVIEVKSSQEIAAFKLDDYPPDLLAFVADTEDLLVQNCFGLFKWDQTSGKLERLVQFTRGIRGYVVSADGKTFVYSGGPGLTKLDLTTLKRQNLKVPLKSTYCSLSPDGRLFAIVAGPALVIWDLVEDKAWLKWKKPNCHSVLGVAFSPDGQRLVCTPDYQVHILDFRTGAKDQVIESPKLKSGELQCVQMSGPDDQMDRESGHFEPLNPLPMLCAECKRVDLDFVPKPYSLGKKIESPVDMAPAVAGNIIVRESMKRAMEVAAPGLCAFHSTINRKTKQPTPWLLAVPEKIVRTAQPSGKKCPKCGAPESWSDDEQTKSPISKHEVFKSENWWGREGNERNVYFSLRLETLVKKLGLRGLVRSYECKQVPTAEDLAWVEEKLRLLKKTALKAGTGKAGDAAAWFKEYLRKNRKKKSIKHDFSSVEKKHELNLPKSYKDFISTVGPKTFKNVNEEEGFAVRIVPPQKLDFKIYRRSSDAPEYEAEGKIDGVMFATTDHGDAFCFDIDAKGADYPVYHYQHELDQFEPYANNFAAAIKRFAGE
jgi:hypothetical protein